MRKYKKNILDLQLITNDTNHAPYFKLSSRNFRSLQISIRENASHPPPQFPPNFFRYPVVSRYSVCSEREIYYAFEFFATKSRIVSRNSRWHRGRLSNNTRLIIPVLLLNGELHEWAPGSECRICTDSITIPRMEEISGML